VTPVTATRTPTRIATATATTTTTATATATCTAAGTPGPWVSRANYPQALSGIAVASDGTYIYGFGGRSSGGRNSAAYKYNYSTDTWTVLPTIIAGPSADFHAEYGNNGKIYVIGGASFGTANRIYDIASNSWSMGAPVPVYVSYYGSAYWNDKIYVIGGVNATPSVDVYAYDIASDTWSTRVPLPQALYGMATVAINGRIYVANGSTGSGVTNSLYIYDINTNTWSAGPPSPLASNGSASTVIGSKLYMISGGPNQFSDTSERAGSGNGKPGTVRGNAEVAGNSPTEYTSTYLYDPVANSWSAGPSLNTDHFRGGAATTNTPGGETAIVVGGYTPPWSGSVEASTLPVIPCSTGTPTGTAATNTPTGTPTCCQNVTASGTASCTQPYSYNYSFTLDNGCNQATAGSGAFYLEFAPTSSGPWYSVADQPFSSRVFPPGQTVLSGTITAFRQPDHWYRIRLSAVSSDGCWTLDVPTAAYRPCQPVTSTLTATSTTTRTATATTQATHTPTANVTPSVNASATNTGTPSVPTSTGTPTATSAPPANTPTVCSVRFIDVPSDHTFYAQVRCLACRGIVSGYADGTFKPDNLVTRGQLAKIVSNAANFTEAPGAQIFQDVPTDHTFYEWINRLTNRGYMSGYQCGSPGEPCVNNRPYFRPFNNATRAQTSKIVSNAARYNDPPAGQTFEDVPPTHPFYVEIQRLASREIMGGYQCGGPGEPCVPTGNRAYFRPYNNVTRGQSTKIVANTFYPECQSSVQPKQRGP
jgi:N-acetylneuraminic acid mutarotase